MTNPFEVLVGFLDRFDYEVEGRDSGEPPEDVQIKLRAFARGELPPGERAGLISLLDQNPRWVLRLSEEVKALRGPAGSKSQE